MTWFWVKGIIGVAGIVLLGIHISQLVKYKIDVTLAQGLRYLALLCTAIAISWASYEQIDTNGITWQPRHRGALVAVALVFIAALASIIEVKLKERKNNVRSSRNP